MYWIPPSLPLKSLSRPAPTVCRTDVGTFERVYADVITNFPSSIAFQFLQECRLRDQLSAHSKPGLPVTILTLWWWRWWLSSLFSTSSRLGQEIKLGLSKYFFLSTYGLSRSFHFIVPYFFVTSSRGRGWGTGGHLDFTCTEEASGFTAVGEGRRKKNRPLIRRSYGKIVGCEHGLGVLKLCPCNYCFYILRISFLWLLLTISFL